MFSNTSCSLGFIGRLITEEVQAQPLKCPTDVIYDFKKCYGVNISYHKTWLGVDNGKKNIFGDLQWYVDAVKNTNHNNRRFFKLFVALDACVKGLTVIICSVCV